MSILGWVCLALLVAYWIWLLVKTGSNRSYVFPGIITVVLGGVAVWSFMTPVAPPSTFSSITGGRRGRY
jgi:hypothetical protein